MSSCLVYDLGTVSFIPALEFQRRLAAARRKGEVGDALLLLEHSPVFTIGRSGSLDDIVVPRELLAAQGIPVLYVNRGGGVTYHGPGQLVGYPIFSLREGGLGAHEFLHRLEKVVIGVLRSFGVDGCRVRGQPGVWVGEEKVCSVGLHISHGISMHGFALNVSPELGYFSYIIPCGLRDGRVTSLAQLVGHEPDIDTVKEALREHFSRVFEVELEEGEARWLARSTPGGW